MKKNICSLLIVILFSPATILFSQYNTDCKEHPIFNAMPDHTVTNCERKEFDKFTFYKTGRDNNQSILEKQGEIITVTYNYSKDWNNRPSNTQIYQNYINAIKKNNGEIIYQPGSYLQGTFKKGDDIYWVHVLTDGSGTYSVTTLRESIMRQDIILSADEIKKAILEEGKATFYNIYFDTDQSALKPVSSEALAEIAKFLKGNPTITLYVVGHTDNSGDQEHNLTLSKKRALAVVSELINKYSIPKTQLEAQGVGPLAPVSSNDNEKGKAKNRRVELVKKNQ